MGEITLDWIGKKLLEVQKEQGRQRALLKRTLSEIGELRDIMGNVAEDVEAFKVEVNDRFDKA